MLKVFVLLALAILFSSCAAVKPWEREKLADPIMIFNENPIDAGIQEHFIEHREGAAGATGAQSGGCGCG
ncbi:MAG: DUF4266 domain-containing protein [Calditrichaeota bacterium]|nr:MAG: DUF4266 domain-containing protein [Calditrichota bacterium]